MHALLFSFFILAASTPLFSQSSTPIRPSPIVILIQKNIESPNSEGLPLFVLYDNNLAIFLKQESDGKTGYASILLSENEFLKALEQFNLSELNHLKDSYELSSDSDEPEYELHTWLKSDHRKIRVTGDLRPPSELRTKMPSSFLKIFDHLISFRHPKASSWMPDKVEILALPYERASSPPIVWPQHWPRMQNPKTVQKKSDSHRFFFDSKQIENLQKILAQQNKDRAIQIDGKKWFLSIRYPFPKEKLWLEP
jgi:hypothetical protein